MDLCIEDSKIFGIHQHMVHLVKHDITSLCRIKACSLESHAIMQLALVPTCYKGHLFWNDLSSVWGPWNWNLISPLFWPSCFRGQCADPHWPSALSPVTSRNDRSRPVTTGKDPAAKQRCDRAVRALGFRRAKLTILSPLNFGKPISHSIN